MSASRPTLVYAAPGCEAAAMSMVCPEWKPTAAAVQGATFTSVDGLFRYVKSVFGKFPDSTPDIELGGFTPHNLVDGSDVVFFASFHTPEATLCSLHALIVLLQSHVKSMTIVAPFFPFATMERVEKEGVVATANTTAFLLSSLPSCGPPTKLVVYDLHTEQNRFYFHGTMLPSMQTAMPLFLRRVPEFDRIDYVFFPDAGAHKRFGRRFRDFKTGYFDKVRRGDQRVLTLAGGAHEYDYKGARIMLIDDLVRTGGTLRGAAAVLKTMGAAWVGACCTHAAGSAEDLMCFSKTRADVVTIAPAVAATDAEPAVAAKTQRVPNVDRLYVTDSVPQTTDLLPKNDVFVVLPLSASLRDVLLPRAH
jgi:phosphoribosylpyrophosphate synthetase